MPSELRRITFGYDELLDALVSYDQHADQKFTCGVIVSATVKDDPTINVSLDVKVYGASSNMSVNLNANYVGAAMVMYCLRENIPIPRNSVRYLKRVDSNVALCLSINEAIEGRATILPDYFSYDVRVAESSAV